MKARCLLFLILVTVFGACNGDVGSGSKEISTIADASVIKACTDDFDPACWMEAWGDFEPPYTFDDAGVINDAGVADAIVVGDVGHYDAIGVDDAGVYDASPEPDAGCTAQPEPTCPQPPPGSVPQNPGIPGGGQCRGACGKACPATCRPGVPITKCLEWQTADCAWHSKTCTYPVLECGSAAGCRTHDACYDLCALLTTGVLRAACRRACDANCIRVYGIIQCNAWRKGNGPFDKWLPFTGVPTSSTADGDCDD